MDSDSSLSHYLLTLMSFKTDSFFFSLWNRNVKDEGVVNHYKLENVISELNGTELVSVNLQWIIRTSFMNLKEQFIGKFGLKSMIELKHYIVQT